MMGVCIFVSSTGLKSRYCFWWLELQPWAVQRRQEEGGKCLSGQCSRCCSKWLLIFIAFQAKPSLHVCLFFFLKVNWRRCSHNTVPIPDTKSLVFLVEIVTISCLILANLPMKYSFQKRSRHTLLIKWTISQRYKSTWLTRSVQSREILSWELSACDTECCSVQSSTHRNNGLH